MRKLDPSSLEARSQDLIAQNLIVLQDLFPEIFVEGKIDFEILRQLLGGAIDEREEKYGLNWHGKRRARQLALTPSPKTLRPQTGDSLNWDTTQNLLNEGDNLEVLKLLQKSYSGRVKLIYIDPPYNTGKDFVYSDHFQDRLRSHLEKTGQAEGGRKLSTNTESSGRFHTDWLNMMYPRLKLAKNLLQQSGVILVSIDDHEVTNLRVLLNEVFGEENFVAQIVWQRSKKGDAKLIANVHEYILCYVRDYATAVDAGLWRKKKAGAAEVLAQYVKFKEQFAPDHDRIRSAMLEWYRGLGDSDPRKDHKHYNWSDDRGLYFAADFAGPDDGRERRPRHDILHPVTGKSCKKPSTGWRWDQEKTDAALAENPPRIHFGADETTIPNRKSYLEEISTEPYPSVFYRDGRSATSEVASLIGKGVFQFPKNTDVLMELIELTTGPEDLILDFFAGSGSLAHAVMKLNQAQRSQRRFIVVQLDEPTSRQDFPTIAEMTKARLRQASQRMRQESPQSAVDLGFRVFKLDSSNLAEWDPASQDLAASLQAHAQNLKSDRTEQDILFELLLKLGLDLCAPISSHPLAGCVLYSVGKSELLACLSQRIAKSDCEALAHGIVSFVKQQHGARSTRVVFRDSAFADDVAKTNLTAILQQHGVSDVRSL